MARSLRKIVSPLVAVLLLVVVVAMQSRAWAAAEDDMVPLMVGITAVGGGMGTWAAPVCLQCRCCSKANPSNCQITGCCSTFDCDPTGKCSLVQQRCGCGGC